MYAENSVELKRKAELSQESAVAACEVYVPYISDILWQLDELMKIFAIEKELRVMKNRGYFPVPQSTPQDNKFKTTQDKDNILEAVDQCWTLLSKLRKITWKNKNKSQSEMSN